MLRSAARTCGHILLRGFLPAMPAMLAMLVVACLTAAPIAQAGAKKTSCPAVTDFNFKLNDLQAPVGDAPEVRFLQKAVKIGFPVPQAWQQRLDKIRGKPPADQLLIVNALVNSLPYSRDLLNEWRMPQEFLKKGGDCEDFAIAKYVLLRQLGYTAENLRLVVVKSVYGASKYHVVVAVRIGSKPADTLVLDIDPDYPRTLIYCDDYKVKLSFNEEKLWNQAAIVGSTPGDIWGGC